MRSKTQESRRRRLEASAERSDRIECECGRPKEKIDDEACARCRFLDGERENDSVLIDLLRGCTWMSIRELAEETGRHHAALLKSLRRLMEAGRVSRTWREVPSIETVGRCRYGGTQRMTVGSGLCAVYSLAYRRAA